jgi:Family of unknown function (DUF6235)
MNFGTPGRLSGRRNQLNAGVDVLNEWSANASQADRNRVYAGLFAVADGTLFAFFQTMTHRARPHELAICFHDKLVVTISRTEPGMFDIVYIGPPEQAPGFGRPDNADNADNP